MWLADPASLVGDTLVHLGVAESSLASVAGGVLTQACRWHWPVRGAMSLASSLLQYPHDEQRVYSCTDKQR